MRRRGQDLKFQHHATFNAPAPGWELGAASVDDGGEFMCLWSSGGQHVVNGSTVEEPLAITFPAGDRYPKIALLPHGGFHVADTRVGVDLATGYRFPVSTWTFDVQGHLVCEGSLGDGIQDALSTPTGQVWVGYFDEGVYGGGETEHHGLVRFNPELEPTWIRHSSPEVWR